MIGVIRWKEKRTFWKRKERTMNIQKYNLLLLAVLAAVLLIPSGPAVADDLNPPSYRGDPLSVFAEWQLIPGTTILNLTQYNWVDDNDPSTTLHPLQVSNPVQPNSANAYQFQLPNFIDNMPIKHLRLQLTWINTPQLPLSIQTQALDGVNTVWGTIVNTSTPVPVAAINGMYQYFDIDYVPNPDFERVNVHLPADAVLWQAVIDTVSTVPEPATLGILGLGALLTIRSRRHQAA